MSKSWFGQMRDRVASDHEMGEPMNQESNSRPYQLCCGLAVLWLVALLWIKWSHPAANGGTADQPALTLIMLVCAVHCWINYRLRATLVFFGIAMFVSFALEASSIATGFPFGFYVHNVAAPKLLGVPAAVPVAYTFLAYLSWSIACVILRSQESGVVRTFGAPVVAAFIMPGYDLAVDPVGSTVGRAWSYLHPSGYFGVPLSNFLGWIVTSWAICQAVALALAALRVEPRARRGHTLYWLVPSLIWVALALQYAIDFSAMPAGTTAVSGRTFMIRDIFESSVITALLAMLPPAIFATLILIAERRATRVQHDV